MSKPFLCPVCGSPMRFPRNRIGHNWCSRDDHCSGLLLQEYGGPSPEILFMITMITLIFMIIAMVIT